MISRKKPLEIDASDADALAFDDGDLLELIGESILMEGDTYSIESSPLEADAQGSPERIAQLERLNAADTIQVLEVDDAPTFCGTMQPGGFFDTWRKAYAEESEEIADQPETAERDFDPRFFMESDSDKVTQAQRVLEAKEVLALLTENSKLKINDK